MPGSPLRILQLYPKADFFTGAAIQLRDLAAGLVARGHHVTVATPPSAMRASRTLSPSRSSATAADASANS